MTAGLPSQDAREGRDATFGEEGRRFLPVKGYIGGLGVALLVLFGCVPLVMAFARLLAYPGMPPMEMFGLAWLRELGGLLNQSFTLEWIPPRDRWTVLYLLLLPTAALMTTLARLTFGLRVLGFRAILIAVGFQEIGIAPSLVLMVAVIATIVLVRPAMRRIRLPLYARISVILCVSAMFMVGALFLGPWARSEVIWSVAFFPVIILAMLAEGIAQTLDRDNALTAAWRAGWTVVLALLIAWVSQMPAVRDLVLRFPELMLTQMVAIVLISEFLDFRLLQDWPSKFVDGERPNNPGSNRIAVVRNRWNTGVIGRLGVSAPLKNRTQSVQPLVDALRDLGFTVRVFEGDMSLLRELRAFLPPDPQSGQPGGLVMNAATGIQGAGRTAHLPAMLEMAGVAYTGPDPIGHARTLDRYLLLSLLQQSGVPVPRFWLVSGEFKEKGDLPFPLAVQPRCESESARSIARNARELDAALQKIAIQHGQEAVVEEYFDSREIRVSLLGNGKVECLPLLQVNAAGSGKRCPAPVDEDLAERIRAFSRRAYAAAGCRDYARIDVRQTRSGEPRVVQVNSVGILARRGSFVLSAKAAGYTLQELMRRIVAEAWLRLGVRPGHFPALEKPSQTSDPVQQRARPTGGWLVGRVYRL